VEGAALVRPLALEVGRHGENVGGLGTTAAKGCTLESLRQASLLQNFIGRVATLDACWNREAMARDRAEPHGVPSAGSDLVAPILFRILQKLAVII
jgi:hypothetical protein